MDWTGTQHAVFGLGAFRNSRSYTIVFAFFVTAYSAATLNAATEVGGALDGEVTWSTAHSPYLVIQNVEVPSGGTLTIDAGVEVRFDRYSLIVKGQIVARGSI